MREFLRGGYKDISELTLVTNHNRPAFTVNPHPYKKKAIDGDVHAVPDIGKKHVIGGVNSSPAHTLSAGK